MVDAGIFDGDIVVVDRSLEPRHGDVVVAVVDGERSLKRLDLSGEVPACRSPMRPSRPLRRPSRARP